MFGLPLVTKSQFKRALFLQGGEGKGQMLTKYDTCLHENPRPKTIYVWRMNNISYFI